MSSVSRRSFLRTAGAIPFAAWFASRSGGQQPAASRIRYEARTPQGVQMLQVYADAVNQMKNRAVGDPRSWTFQWYSHWVDGDTSKDAEINRIYPNQNDPNRATAQAMWNTCQAHGENQNEDYFLPWHRCFVLYFEQIIAAVGMRPDFALPYWNYSTSDLATRGVIPPQFTQLNSPLFDAKRNPNVNQGLPIQGNNQDALSLSSLNLQSYSGDDGFCADLDNGLHGNVHVLVGNTKNMGRIPYAAQDPIFWMHHCNLDRLWASWNAAGNTNPQLDDAFTFVDGTGQTVVANLSNFLDISTVGYTYDRFEPVPGPNLRVMAESTPVSESVAITSQAEGVKLGAESTRVPLKLGPTVSSVTARLTRVERGKKVYVVVSGLATKIQPGVLYDLYLDLPPNPTPQQRDDHRLGTINFFGVPHAGGHGGKPAHGAAAGNARTRYFEVTGKLRALGLSRALAEQPVLTISPQGQPQADAEPVIAKIELTMR
jgi:tyrosinase